MITSLNERKIVSISCGNNYNLAIDSDGNLFSWGIGQGVGTIVMLYKDFRTTQTHIVALLFDQQRPFVKERFPEEGLGPGVRPVLTTRTKKKNFGFQFYDQFARSLLSRIKYLDNV